jgi:hypothetical protein
MRNLLVMCCALAASGCLRTTEYRGGGDSACGAGGVCETSGFCSFIDGECTSGRRYNDSAGSLGGTCTNGGSTQEDADVDPIDMQLVDSAMADVPMAQCPAGYVTLTGGNPGHLYRVLTVAANWASQEAACQLTTVKAHLAVPDDITELTALDTAIGGTLRYWIGVTDAPPATEGTFVTVLGANATYLPWDPPAPDDAGPGEDCVEAIPATHEFNDERCNQSRPAICECAP